MKKGLQIIAILAVSLLFFKVAQADIQHPYVVDEKEQVLFGDSALVDGHQGLENYTADYVGGYLHITYTYSHGSCCYAGYPPVLYITDVDPRTVTTPVVRALLTPLMIFPWHPTNWYTFDIQFDATGYTTIVKEAGVTEISNEHTNTLDIQDTDWVALANLYPWSATGGEPSAFSMSFTPLPVKTDAGCTENCFSNVLFLPGLKGSVLQKGPDTLWPPTVFDLSNDVLQLALNQDGTSVNDITVDGILNEGYAYGPFSDFMNELVSEGTIDSWLPLAYDWRFSAESVLEDGVKTDNGVVDVIEKLEELAANSRTGQVTIVAHSMGGLLGKALIAKLEQDGKDNLIDSFVMVGSPQLGTPQAIASMLHGDGEDILGGLMVNRADIRTISLDMPSAYSLLPSREYFTEVLDPVIKFDSNASFTDLWRNIFGEIINDYLNLSSFLSDAPDVRDEPNPIDMSIPEILRADLLDQAADFHDIYDNYQIPSHIRVVQVAGWGVPTVKAVNYKTNHGFQSYEVVPTVEGDKTVVYPSAVSSGADESFFFDLAVFNSSEGLAATHKDLLSTFPIQEIVKNVLENKNIPETTFIKINKPDPGNLKDKLVVSTHSPVILGVQNENGNFTGIDPNQNLSQDIWEIKEEIPGSTFLHTNDIQYIFLPKEGSYDFVYKGVGNGPTTVVIENFSNDDTQPIAEFVDIPTTLNTVASFTVNSNAPESTTVSLDADGDGNPDKIISKGIYEFSGFLQPINYTAHQVGADLNVFKAGSTVPVKFQIKKHDGTVVQATTAPLWLTPLKGSKMSETVDESVYSVAGTTGNTYRWDPITQQYIYNWSTKGFEAGRWYKIFAQLDDGNIYSVTIGLR